MPSITLDVIDFTCLFAYIRSMSSSFESPQSAFPDLLRTWRSRRRLSQLNLALDAGLSQRHISFLETGKSKPSRHAVSQLGEALDMPAAEIDAMLVTAGFAARFSDNRWGEDTRIAVAASIDHVLEGHEPFPAVSIDRMWNLQKANSAALRFFALLGSTGEPNLLRDIMRPGPVRASIVNWEDSARALMRLFELEVARRPNDIEARNLLEELHAIPGVKGAVGKFIIDNPSPVLAIQFRLGDRILNLFSLIATIGMSADAAIDDVRIETLLPADEATRKWFSQI